MNRITMLRKEKGMSQIALSIKLNVSQKMISAYETGRHQPTMDMLIALADFFNVSIDYLVGKSEIRFPADSLFNNNLSAKELKLLNSFRTLTDEKKEQAIGVLFALQNI